MTLRLNTADADFEDRFEALLAHEARSRPPTSNDAVAAIIAKVRAEGDAALIELTLRFDGLDLDNGRHAGQHGGDRRGASQVDARTLAGARARRMTASSTTTTGNCPRRSLRRRAGVELG